MSNSANLPAVVTRCVEDGIEAVVAFSLTSVISAELASAGSGNNNISKNDIFALNWEGREKLMQAMAVWPSRSAWTSFSKTPAMPSAKQKA